MKFHISSGEQVIVFLKDRLLPKDEPVPFMATVLKVHRGIIIIPELESYNGLAKIRIHGTSKTEGCYWYEYVDKNSEGKSFDIVKLQKISGEVIKTEKFIEEE